MHFINRCAWKSSQYYIIITMMTLFMHMSQKLVFHQSKCICANMRLLSTTAMYVSFSMLLRCMLKFKHLACGIEDVTHYKTPLTSAHKCRPPLSLSGLGVVLQSLRCRCVGYVIHHERDVREEQKYRMSQN